MVLEALRRDALTRSDSGLTVRLALPWIRALPLAALTDVELTIDGEVTPEPQVLLGERVVTLTDLAREPGWWFVQDRVVLHADRAIDAGLHVVRVAFRLAVPYLQIAPDGPLVLPFLFERALDTDAAAPATSVARDVAGGTADTAVDTAADLEPQP